MKSALRPTLTLILGIALVLGVVWRMGAAEEKKAEAAGGARYTVVATDGAHLIVTDNATNRLYYYAIDKDGKIGDALKLRGTVDLTEFRRVVCLGAKERRRPPSGAPSSSFPSHPGRARLRPASRKVTP
jgi:hypothetical protein